MEPTTANLGDIVWYVEPANDNGQILRAAMITEFPVDPSTGIVSIKVYSSEGAIYDTVAQRSDTQITGRWMWRS